MLHRINNYDYIYSYINNCWWRLSILKLGILENQLHDSSGVN